MSTEAQKPTRTVWKIIVLLSLSSCILPVGYLFFDDWNSQRLKESIFYSNQESKYGVTDTFLFALADKRLETMKIYVVEEKWDELEPLSNEFNVNLEECKLPWDPDHRGMGFGNPISSTRFNYGGWTNLDCKNGDITLEGSFELIKIDDKWFIHNWSDIQIGPKW